MLKYIYTRKLATIKSTIILFVCPPKFCISIFFKFSLGTYNDTRETGNNAYVKGTKKEYYGIFDIG